MEIQQKDIEALTAYIRHSKTAAKQCTFDSDTAQSEFSLKDFEMQTMPQLKFTKKDPQTLAEVIRLVEKLNAAQQITAMLTPCMVSKMFKDDRYFVCGKTCALWYNTVNTNRVKTTISN